MEELVKFEDEFLAIEVSVFQGGRIAVKGVVEGSEVGEGWEVVAVGIFNDSGGLITAQIAIGDEDVLVGLDGSAEIECDETIFALAVDGGDQLAAPVGGDAKARCFWNGR